MKHVFGRAFNVDENSIRVEAIKSLKVNQVKRCRRGRPPVSQELNKLSYLLESISGLNGRVIKSR